MSEEQFSMRTVKTPVGTLWLIARGEEIWGAEFEGRWPQLVDRLAKKGVEVGPGAIRKKDRPVLVRAVKAIENYFAGDLMTIRAIPLSLEGSKMQVAVWGRVRKIRPGKTKSYGELAEAVGMPGAFRAIGAANAANPCVLFVPDHRVVSGDGGLRGYGSGVEKKAWLLTHEGVPS
jgi:methylated-DNA-[protein]-cysteine S-methyltransferase